MGSSKGLFCVRNTSRCSVEQHSLSDPTHTIVVIWVNIFQTELTSENYSKSPVRAIAKVLLMKFS